MNPIMQLLNQQNNANGIFDLFKSVMNAQNPTDMFNSLLPNNPQLQQVMNYVKQHGGNPQQAFYDLAKERGVDPNSVLSALNQ